MTPQEAIRRIKNHNEIHSRKEKHFAVHITEALNMAVKALEKQIPEKPANKSLEFDGEYGYCPCCNRILADHSNFRRCPDCGQALDWSDTE